MGADQSLAAGAKEIFDLIDEDKSGSIDAKEAKELVISITSFGELRSILAGANYDVFTSADQNKDGQVSLEELSKFFQTQGVTAEQLKQIKAAIVQIRADKSWYASVNAINAVMDNDKSGGLDANELLMLVSTLSSSKNQNIRKIAGEINAILEKFDTTKDGQIQKSELIAWFRSGKLSAADAQEVAKIAAEMKPKITEYCAYMKKAESKATEAKAETKATEAKAGQPESVERKTILCGGRSGTRALDEREQAIVASIKEAVEQKAGKKLAKFEGKSVRTQVVAGCNYFFEIDIGDKTIQATVWGKLDGTNQLTAVSGL